MSRARPTSALRVRAAAASGPRTHLPAVLERRCQRGAGEMLGGWCPPAPLRARCPPSGGSA
eukprot:5673480-Alexandrium_andersonii.AAC.1